MALAFRHCPHSREDSWCQVCVQGLGLEAGVLGPGSSTGEGPPPTAPAGLAPMLRSGASPQLE